jgi:dTDP-3-amino-3,4,6-trideoxy-alpha-D-glucose transaminase
MVSYFDFKSAPLELQAQWRGAIDSVIREGVFISGTKVEGFEQRWADYLGVQGCVGVANGLDALTLALKGVGVGHGDRVAVPAHTFIASWLAICNTGATPVGVDVDERGLIDIALLESTGGNFKAVMPVHLHGLAVDMPRLMKWANECQVLVVEDCAQAHGAAVGGKMLGSWGHASAFSFYPTKNLGALGDAGAVVSSDTRVLSRVRMLANYGACQTDKYEHIILGLNSRLDPIQAAILNVNLDHLENWNRRRREIASFYNDALSSLPNLATGLECDLKDSVWHHYVLFSPERDTLRAKLTDLNVATDMHYPRTAASEVSLILENETPTLFPKADYFANNALSLPLNQWMSVDDVDFVVSALSKVAAV